MDISVSSNFERLLWFLIHSVSNAQDAQERREAAGIQVKEWQTDLKTKGEFKVEQKVLDAAKVDFGSERVSDAETVIRLAMSINGLTLQARRATY